MAVRIEPKPVARAQKVFPQQCMRSQLTATGATRPTCYDKPCAFFTAISLLLANPLTHHRISSVGAGYVEDMYHTWKEDPEAVHASWRSVFARMDAGALPGQTFTPPPTIESGQSLQASAVPAAGLNAAGQQEVSLHRLHHMPCPPPPPAMPRTPPLSHGWPPSACVHLQVTKVMQLIAAYQARGHNVADLDPLGMYVHPSSNLHIISHNLP